MLQVVWWLTETKAYSLLFNDLWELEVLWIQVGQAICMKKSEASMEKESSNILL